MKKWQILKSVLYLISAVFIFIFNEAIMPYVGIAVGAIVCMYAAEELIVITAQGKFFKDVYHLFDGISQLLIGIIMFLVSGDIVKVCLVWGVWSILRESKEMSEAIDKLSQKKFGIINIIESIVIIALSFVMILEPGERHAHLHVILLGAELVIVVLFYFVEELRDSFFGRGKSATDNSGDNYDEEITI